METTINQRIIKFIENQGISAYKLAKEIGTSEAVISNIKTEKNKPNIEIVEKILNKYEGLDANWLINGTGNMIKKTDEKNQNISSKGHQIVNSHSSAIITADKNMNELKKENNTLKKRINELEKDKEFLQNLLTKLKK